MKQTPPKMEATYLSKIDRLDLVYDRKAQHAIHEMASRTVPVFDSREWDLENEKQQLDPQSNFELQHGARILAQLGSSRSLHFTTTGHEAGLALFTLCWSTLRLLHKRKSVRHAGSAILLLAKVTPVPILSVPLPPLAEVLDIETVSTAVCEAYEVLRAAGPDGFPQLRVFQAHQLWQELRSLPRPSENIKRLVVFLNVGCPLFRPTMEALARHEVVSRKKKGARK